MPDSAVRWVCLSTTAPALSVLRDWLALHVHESLDDGDGLLGMAQLVLTELVTNAYQHASGPYEVILRCLPDRVRIEVADRSTALPHGHHYGLRLVEALALRWGVAARPAGKIVWAELLVTVPSV
ncbi:ATP-binding protein [Kutzneria sp. NPDC051319]|uniref:ATP-binding protein n=1 Tax=Kutzneria sp. NPDC051319 TaxID=3155047 RepID=UPI00342E3FCD